ncbi:MAG: DUF1007 family protein [Pseudomonadota bacterium]
MTIWTFLTAAAIGLSTLPATAHPHVFVDARIGLVVDEKARLEAIRVTWLFDAFHTLYILAFDGITPSPAGTLDAPARAQLARSYTDWQRDFDGFAKLSLAHEPVALDMPSDVGARLIGDRLEITFSRALAEPAALSEFSAEISVFDSSYYHAVSVAAPPTILGDARGCAAVLIPFESHTQTAEIRASLASLSREELPPIADIGALFADRIRLSCE